MTAAPLGATELNTAEFLLGSVLVTPVFLESNGQIDTQTQNWDPQEIDDVLAKITEGVNWWSTTLDQLDTVHTLDFVIDDTFAKDPFETAYEPIDRTSGTFNQYVGDFFTAQGLGDSPSLARATKDFNDAQREKFDTDWSFTIFVADSSDDLDGAFASGGQFSSAFAFAGGLFFVAPSTRPASTFAHELGHIFWARDEYPGGGSYTDQRGYYNAQNLNAADNPAGGQEPSILRGGAPLHEAYDTFTSPESTLAFVGWRDSDGDGIFDLADVPLDLDVTGYFDNESSTFVVSGTAAAVPLINQNSSGIQSDITLNEIGQVQYRIDGGDWQTLAAPDAQIADIDLSIPITSDFDTIEVRAIDLSTGVTSPIVLGTPTEHLISSGGIRGFAFLDDDSNGQRDLTESFLPGTQVNITHVDGSDLFSGSVAAADFDTEEVPASINGVALTADAFVVNQLSVGDSVEAGDARVFRAFDSGRNRFVDGWNDTTIFEAEFDELVGEVTINTIGLSTGSFEIGSYARIEAYDANGLLITRTTSDLIEPGADGSVTVQDPHGQISRIRAFGHSGTNVAITSIEFGSAAQLNIAPDGAWQFDNLADGEYQLEFVTQNVIHQVAPVQVQVANGTSALVVAAIDRVDSPLHNTLISADVDSDSSVSARDALLVINDISRDGARVLTANDTQGHKIDVNNDGMISALDALTVINSLNDTAPEGESEVRFSQTERTDAAIADFGSLSEETYTNEPVVQLRLDSDWVAIESTGRQMLNSADQIVDGESDDPQTTDTRSDGVALANFSSTFLIAGSSADGPETAQSDVNDVENAQKPVNSASLEDHIESNLSEPNDDLRV